MIKYRKIKHYKYQLLDDYAHQTIFYHKKIEDPFLSMTDAGVLIIHKGYSYDGPSGPTYDSKNTLRAALVHDALYQLMREGKLEYHWKATVDDMFYNILIEDGMSKFRAWAWLKGVRHFGKYSSRPKGKK